MQPVEDRTAVDLALSTPSGPTVTGLMWPHPHLAARSLNRQSMRCHGVTPPRRPSGVTRPAWYCQDARMWWNQDAFTQMPSGRKSERDRLWDAFYLHFDFKPGMDSSPAIREPTPSLTFDLSPIFSAEGAAFTNAETRVNDEVLAARQSAFGDRRLAVLDWQHPAYWFRRKASSLPSSRTGPSRLPERGLLHDDHGAELPVRQVPSAEHAAGVRPQRGVGAGLPRRSRPVGPGVSGVAAESGQLLCNVRHGSLSVRPSKP